MRALLHDLIELPCIERMQVTVTLNVSETLPHLINNKAIPLEIIENKVPKGFGANHNAAFSQAPFPDERRYFFVVNPDVRIQEDVFTPLASLLEIDSDVGTAAPLVRDLEYKLEDSFRYLPTPTGLFAKLFGQQGRWPIYGTGRFFQPDWVAGMFMAFRAETFSKIAGFNDSYFLYYEDVDICSRLWLNGFKIQVDSSLTIIHDARRTSRKRIRYFSWHLASIGRFFLSDTYRQAKKFHAKRKLEGD